MSKEIEKMIIYDEGLELKAYICPAGKKTAGYGHNLDADPALHILHRSVKLGEPITQEEANLLLQYDINKVHNNLVERLPYYNTLQEKYKKVLVNMTFNMGISGVMKFKNMLAAMKNDNDEEVIRQIKTSQYYRQVNKRAKRMIALINNESVPEYS